MPLLSRFPQLTRLRESFAEPGHLWRSTSRTSRLMLLAGVFFLFAIIGLLSELTAVVQHGDWRHLVLVGAFSGAVSAAYVVAIAGGPR